MQEADAQRDDADGDRARGEAADAGVSHQRPANGGAKAPCIGPDGATGMTIDLHGLSRHGPDSGAAFAHVTTY